MKNYCLNADEVFNILKWRELGVPIECEEMALKIDGAKCWTTRIVCISLFFARILEKDKISAQALKKRIAVFYSMGDELWVEMQEGNFHFIEYLLKHLRNKDDSLEESLIEIQNRLSEYNYEKTVRY
ncbi:MAG: hypothetical protein WAZ60_20060 [Desulfosalsimonadaceae bacterium]